MAYSLGGLWLALGTSSSPGAQHPSRILVLPKSSKITAFHQKTQRKVVNQFPRMGNLQVVEILKTETVADALVKYKASGLVTFAEPDYAVSAATVLASDPRFQDGTQWALNNYGQSGGITDVDIDAPESWDVLHFSTNVVVAVIDSGIRHTHEDLAANIWRNPVDGTPGFNALSGQHDPWDENGHGSHIAGIIGAVGNNSRGVAGVSWGVQLMACRFLDAQANGFNSDAVACIDFARTNGAHVLNLSWGSAEYSEAVSNALWHAREAGILVSAAAGNTILNTDVTPFYPASIKLDNIVVAGAHSRTDTIWSLSNYGATNVDLFAPGVSVYSTTATADNSYGNRDGSSQSAAFVSGALALLREQSFNSEPADLIHRLLFAVDRSSSYSGRCISGGRLNIRKIFDWPSVASITVSNSVQLEITGKANHRYLLVSSTNLQSWSPIRTNNANSLGRWTFVETNEPAGLWKFYQARPAP